MAISETNILARIPGEYIAEAVKTLPPAATSKEPNLETTIEVPGKGRVRFTCMI